MNKYNAFAYRIPGGFGYHAMLRFGGDATAKPLLGPHAKPRVFNTELDALKACLANVLGYMNGCEMRGEKFEGGAYSKAALARQKAENLFREE